jgi:hypothetical protein
MFYDELSNVLFDDSSDALPDLGHGGCERARSIDVDLLRQQAFYVEEYILSDRIQEMSLRQERIEFFGISLHLSRITTKRASSRELDLAS